MTVYLKAMAIVALGAVCAAVIHGQQAWQRTYNDTRSNKFSVCETADGRYGICGATTTGSTNKDTVFLMKINESGDPLWTKKHALPFKTNDPLMDVLSTSDSGYLINMRLSGGNCLIKTDSLGDTAWQRVYNVSSIFEYQPAGTVCRLLDDCYLVAGSSYRDAVRKYDIVLVKYSAIGDSLWTKYIDKADDQFCYDMQATTDSGSIFVGADSGKLFIVKMDSLGDTIWTRTYNNIGFWNKSGSIQQTSDGGFFTAGDGPGVLWHLVRINPSGDTLWSRTYGSMTELVVIDLLTDGCVLASTGFYFNIVKTNPDGDSLWSRPYFPPSSNKCQDMHVTMDGGYVMAGVSSWDRFLHVVKADSTGYAGIGGSEPGPTAVYSRLKVKPNPFTRFAEVPGHEAEWFLLYDISGRRLGRFKGAKIGAGLGTGVYLLKPENAADQPVRIVKIK